MSPVAKTVLHNISVLKAKAPTMLSNAPFMSEISLLK